MNIYLVNGSNTNNCIVSGNLGSIFFDVEEVLKCNCIDCPCVPGGTIFFNTDLGENFFKLLDEEYRKLLNSSKVF